mmetsp:Transcript_23254/g.35033  ORF Transcript_23254/g.35033 Transcript_23254/m.35033 type:complete len:218 (-) Transcript_23254:264-917(-)
MVSNSSSSNQVKQPSAQRSKVLYIKTTETMVSNSSSSFMAVAAVLLLLSSQGEAFAPSRPSLSTNKRCSSPLITIGRMTQLQMSTDDEEEIVGLPPLPSDAGKVVKAVEQKAAPAQQPAAAAVVSSNSAVEEEELQAYPIDLPSPILLATSMVLAISSIGSLFELAGGTPKLGFAVTAAITALGLPISVFLIYAAILKGSAETEEADREFMNKPRRL